MTSIQPGPGGVADQLEGLREVLGAIVDVVGAQAVAAQLDARQKARQEAQQAAMVSAAPAAVQTEAQAEAEKAAREAAAVKSLGRRRRR